MPGDATLPSILCIINVADSSIIDFTGGVKDVQDKVLRIIGDPVIRYQEDPVRMIRV